jgi:hypothetical protein
MPDRLDFGMFPHFAFSPFELEHGLSLVAFCENYPFHVSGGPCREVRLHHRAQWNPAFFDNSPPPRHNSTRLLHGHMRWLVRSVIILMHEWHFCHKVVRYHSSAPIFGFNGRNGVMSSFMGVLHMQ